MRVFNNFSLAGAAFLFLQSPLISHAQDILLPELLGPYKVGITSFEVINTAYDPPRDLMVYAYYPISNASSHKYPLARDFSPTFAKWLDNFENFTGSDRIVTRAQDSAPILSSSFPVILFGPGYGEPVRLSGAQTMSNLASQGYIVVGVDHPNDSQIIEYPDGRVAYYYANEDFEDYDYLVPFVDARVSDMNFVASQLRNTSVTKSIPGLTAKRGLDFESLGIFGFSLGGASSGSTMLSNPIFACGANLDGLFIGNISKLGLDNPFLLMNAETHPWDSDETWPAFYYNLRGYRRDVQILGTRHKSYSDWLILKNLLVKNDTDPANANLIPGTRMLEIHNTYVTNFFDLCFKNGTGKLLDERNSTKFPEVRFLP